MANLLTIKERVKESEINRLVYPNQKIYQGKFKHDKPEGHGILIHNDGSIVKGIWKAGKIESVH